MKAHRLIWLAARNGVQDGVVEALFEGYFCQGADLGDDQVLADIVQRGGLDRGAALALLAGDEGQREVFMGDQMARNCGIQGVPSFALQGHVLFSGAVPAEEMAASFRRAWELLKNKAA
jgi:predicted DsbA family dithiol-disulfide isomerase